MVQVIVVVGIQILLAELTVNVGRVDVGHIPLVQLAGGVDQGAVEQVGRDHNDIARFDRVDLALNRKRNISPRDIHDLDGLVRMDIHVGSKGNIGIMEEKKLSGKLNCW